jgi:hypothetical protein
MGVILEFMYFGMWRAPLKLAGLSTDAVVIAWGKYINKINQFLISYPPPPPSVRPAGSRRPRRHESRRDEYFDDDFSYGEDEDPFGLNNDYVVEEVMMVPMPDEFGQPAQQQDLRPSEVAEMYFGQPQQQHMMPMHSAPMMQHQPRIMAAPRIAPMYAGAGRYPALPAPPMRY